MDGSVKELSAYRYSKALEDLTASEVMLKESLYKVSINRSYCDFPCNTCGNGVGRVRFIKTFRCYSIF